MATFPGRKGQRCSANGQKVKEIRFQEISHNYHILRIIQPQKLFETIPFLNFHDILACNLKGIQKLFIP